MLKAKMPHSFLLENSSMHRVCRFQSVRDLLLLYGYKLDYATLMLLGTSMSATCFELQYKGIRFPVISPGFFEGELSILDSLSVKYRVVSINQDCANIDRTLDDGVPVLCYYSADSLNNSNTNESIGPMSSCIVIERDRINNEYITNLSSVQFSHNQPYEKLIGAMQARLRPISPQGRYVFICEINNLDSKLYIDGCAAQAIRRCIEYQSVETISESRDGVLYYSGGKACQIMQDFFEKIGRNDFGLSPRDLDRFYAIYLRIAIRFWSFEYIETNDGFDRVEYIKAVLQRFPNGNHAALSLLNEIIHEATVWNEIFDLLCSAGRPRRSSHAETLAHAKSISALFGKAKEFDDRMFLALSQLTL